MLACIGVLSIVVSCLLGVVWGMVNRTLQGSRRRYLHVRQKVEERRCENEVAGVCSMAEILIS